MTDRALSEEAMLAGLRDIHLPTEAAGGDASDMAAAVALAGILVLVIGGALRRLSQKRTPRRTRRLSDSLDELKDTPEAERRVALLHLLKAHAPDRFEALRPHLYQRAFDKDAERLEAEVRALV